MQQSVCSHSNRSIRHTNSNKKEEPEWHMGIGPRLGTKIIISTPITHKNLNRKEELESQMGICDRIGIEL